MSGRHAVQRHHTVPWLLKSARVSWRPLVLGCRMAARGWRWAVRRWDNLTAGIRDRFAADEMWADAFEEECPAVEVTSPDPIPLPDTPEPAPAEALAPQGALRRLHDEHPDLPGARLRWRFTNTEVHGEVYALDGTETEHRAIVETYASVLQVPVRERPSEHVTGEIVVAAVGVFAGVPVRVETTLCPSVPMRTFEEASQDPTLTSALTTQGISLAALREVVSA